MDGFFWTNSQDRFWMYCSKRWAKKEINSENVWEETREAAAQYVASILDQQSPRAGA